MINKEMQSYFLAYLDGELAAEEKERFESYLANDPEAQAELESMQNIITSIRELPQKPLPDGFSDLLHGRLLDEKNAAPARKGFLTFSWWKPVAAVAALALFVAAANSGIFSSLYDAARINGSSANYISGAPATGYGEGGIAAAPDVQMAEMGEAPADDAGNKDIDQEFDTATVEQSNQGVAADAAAGGALNTADPNTYISGTAAAIDRKVIKNSNISIETVDYNSAFAAISAVANKYGGYVVSGFTNNNQSGEPDSGYLSIRVASASMEAALSEIRTLGDVKNEDFSGEDVTSQYIDVESMLKQYRIQETRLLELFNKAATVADMITIENELARVRGEIESLEGQIRYLTQVTDLSLINVNITVPQHLSSGGFDFSDWHSFWQKLGSSFVAGITFIAALFAKGIFALGYILPLLIILAIIFIIVWLIVRRAARKHGPKGQ